MLAQGFLGPRPGSNAFPLVELRDDDGDVPGERIAELARIGILVGIPAGEEIECLKGGDGGDMGEIPDVELTHRYYIVEGA